VTTSELFRDVIPHYAETHRVIAVDLRGYGQSSKPASGYTMQGFSDDLAAFWDALDLPPGILLGVSMGGFVAQLFALDHPEKLSGLVLASTSDGRLGAGIDFSDIESDFAERGWQAVSSDLITGAFPPGADPAIVRKLLDRIGTWNETVISGAIRSVLDFRTTDRLSGITAPTLVMVGEGDHQLPVPLSEDMARRIPNSHLEVFPKVGHFMMVEAPDDFIDRLDRFLASLPETRGAAGA
jgi:3-oxoadipate enol-lactonase